jgi:hypothetical protein
MYRLYPSVAKKHAADAVLFGFCRAKSTSVTCAQNSPESMQLLLLALLGALATSAAWQVCGAIFLSVPVGDQYLESWPGVKVGQSEDRAGESQAAASAATGGAPSSATHEPTSPGGEAVAPASESGEPPVPMVDPKWTQLFEGPWRLAPYYFVIPLQRLFVESPTWRETLYYLFGSLLTIVFWGFFGGAIARTAALRFCRDERVGLQDSLNFARRKLLSLFGGPTLPLVGILLIAIPLYILGLIMKLDIGIFLGGIVWLLALLTGFIMALMAIGLLFGWPLMWSTIGTEGTDAFDAISRSYAYTYQRPLHYAFYAALALFLGALGWVIVWLFCQGVVEFANWGVSVGMGSQRFERLASPEGSWSLRSGAAMIQLFNAFVYSLATAYCFSYFWVAATAVYLLLRHDADQTELDDVYVEDEEESTYGLPPVSVDEEKPGEEMGKPAEAEGPVTASAEAAAGTAAESPPAEPSSSGSAESPHDPGTEERGS